LFFTGLLWSHKITFSSPLSFFGFFFFLNSCYLFNLGLQHLVGWELSCDFFYLLSIKLFQSHYSDHRFISLIHIDSSFFLFSFKLFIFLFRLTITSWFRTRLCKKKLFAFLYSNLVKNTLIISIYLFLQFKRII
jgi:hypothetical protein